MESSAERTDIWYYPWPYSPIISPIFCETRGNCAASERDHGWQQAAAAAAAAALLAAAATCFVCAPRIAREKAAHSLHHKSSAVPLPFITSAKNRTRFLPPSSTTSFRTQLLMPKSKSAASGGAGGGSRLVRVSGKLQTPQTSTQRLLLLLPAAPPRTPFIVE